MNKANARVKNYYKRLRQNGGAKVTVTLKPHELEAVSAMASSSEPVARTVRRVVLERAYDLGHIEAVFVPPRIG